MALGASTGLTFVGLAFRTPLVRFRGLTAKAGVRSIYALRPRSSTVSYELPSRRMDS
jgi:hypothetical protein